MTLIGLCVKLVFLPLFLLCTWPRVLDQQAQSLVKTISKAEKAVEGNEDTCEASNTHVVGEEDGEEGDGAGAEATQEGNATEQSPVTRAFINISRTARRKIVASVREGSERMLHTMTLVLQSVQVIALVTRIDIDWTGVIKDISGVLSLAILEFDAIVGPTTCDDTPYVGKFWFRTAGIVLVVSVGFVFLHANVVGHFTCFEKSSGNFYLTSVPNVKCWQSSGEWGDALPVAIVGFVLFSVGIPLVLGGLVTLININKSMDNRHTIQRMGFLYEGYDRKCVTYERRVLLFKFILVLGMPLILTNALDQVLFMLTLLLLFLMDNLWKQPYARTLETYMEISVLCCVILTAVYGVLTMIDSMNAVVISALGWILISTYVVSFVFLFAVLSVDIWTYIALPAFRVAMSRLTTRKQPAPDEGVTVEMIQKSHEMQQDKRVLPPRPGAHDRPPTAREVSGMEHPKKRRDGSSAIFRALNSLRQPSGSREASFGGGASSRQQYESLKKAKRRTMTT